MKVKLEIEVSEALYTAINVEANHQGRKVETLIRTALREYLTGIPLSAKL